MKSRMPTRLPACFNSQYQWNIYKFQAERLASRDKLEPRFNFCTDCTPEYRNQMVAEGRCRFPATRFKVRRGVVVGVRVGKSSS